MQQSLLQETSHCSSGIIRMFNGYRHCWQSVSMVDGSDGFVALSVFQEIRSKLIMAWRSAREIGTMTGRLKKTVATVQNGPMEAGGTIDVPMQI